MMYYFHDTVFNQNQVLFEGRYIRENVAQAIVLWLLVAR